MPQKAQFVGPVQQGKRRRTMATAAAKPMTKTQLVATIAEEMG